MTETETLIANMLRLNERTAAIIEALTAMSYAADKAEGVLTKKYDNPVPVPAHPNPNTGPMIGPRGQEIRGQELADAVERGLSAPLQLKPAVKP